LLRRCDEGLQVSNDSIRPGQVDAHAVEDGLCWIRSAGWRMFGLAFPFALALALALIVVFVVRG